MTFELPDNTDLVLAGVVKESELAQFENILTTTLVEATVKDFSLLFRGGKTNLQADKFEKLYKIKLKPECGCEGMDKGFSLEPITGSCSGLDTHILTVGIDTWYIANIPNTNMAIVGYNGIFDITENIDFDHDCLDVRFFKHKQYKMLKENYIGPTIVNDKIKLGVCPEGSRAIPPGGVIFDGLDIRADSARLYNLTSNTICISEVINNDTLAYTSFAILNDGDIYSFISRKGLCNKVYAAMMADYVSYSSYKTAYIGLEYVSGNPNEINLSGLVFNPGGTLRIYEVLASMPITFSHPYQWGDDCMARYPDSQYPLSHTQPLMGWQDLIARLKKTLVVVAPCA